MTSVSADDEFYGGSSRAGLATSIAAGGEAEVGARRKRLRSLLKRFRGAHDFAHFTRSGAAYTCAHDTQRHIARVAAREAVRDEAGAAFVVLAISGARFLYPQVRSMVGAVVACKKPPQLPHSRPIVSCRG